MQLSTLFTIYNGKQLLDKYRRFIITTKYSGKFYGVSNIFHTFTIHQVIKLDFAILENGNGAVNLTTRYFRLIPKHRSEQMVFLLFTKYFLEILYVIEKSGFQNSDNVLFFSSLSPLNDKTVQITTELVKFLPKSKVSPFHAPIIYFQVGTEFGTLICLQTQSLDEIKLAALSLNSNGYGQTVQFLVSQSSLASFFPEVLPNDICFKQRASYQNNHKFILRKLKLCNRKFLLSFLSLQHELSISLTAKQSQIPIKQQTQRHWHLQFSGTPMVLLHYESLDMLNVEGNMHTNLEVLSELLEFSVCLFYADYTIYDLTIFTIVDWTAWTAILTTCILLAFIMFDISKAVSILGIMIGVSLDLEKFDRRLVWCFLLPLNIFCYVQQSYISSDSTRLRTIPTSLSWFIDRGFKLSVTYKSILEIGYYTIAPHFLKTELENILDGHGIEDFITEEKIPTTNITDVAKAVTKTRIIVSGLFEEHLFFRRFVGNNYLLIDDKYACFSRTSPEIQSYSKISLRITGYMSGRTNFLLMKAFETGEFEKFQRLSFYLHAHHKSVRSTKVTYLNKFAPPQPIDIKPIVGLSCFGIFILGGANLGINAAVFFIMCFSKWVKKFLKERFESWAARFTVLRFNIRKFVNALNLH